MADIQPTNKELLSAIKEIVRDEIRPLDKKIDDLAAATNAFAEHTESRFNTIDKRFDRIEGRLSTVEGDVSDIKSGMVTKYDLTKRLDEFVGIKPALIKLVNVLEKNKTITPIHSKKIFAQLESQ